DFSNVVIDGFASQTTPTAFNGGAVQVRDLITYDNQVLTGKIKLTNVKVSNTPNLFITGATGFTLSATSFGTSWTTGAATGAALTKGKWATVDGVDLLAHL
ncbi:MAG: hypothetical protein EOO43_21975, partial [Flavobacterium sp.]